MISPPHPLLSVKRRSLCPSVNIKTNAFYSGKAKHFHSRKPFQSISRTGNGRYGCPL